MFDLSIFKSKELGDILRFLPGVVVQERMSMQGMADLYRIKPDILERLIKSTTIMIEHPYSSSSLESHYILDDYLSSFLRDRGRCQLCYCDPMLQHISICRHFLFFLDGSNAFDLQSNDELSDYVSSRLYDHLYKATSVFFHQQNITDDHPAVEILRYLENTTYCVDKNLPSYIRRLARCIIQVILRWADMLNRRLRGVTVSVSNVDLMERMCHLTNKIYREMLCITRHERMTYITMGGLGLDHVQVSAISCTPSLQYRTVLSWDLLAWITVQDGIPCSFTNFITTPELSGRLYISPDIYHTQITEYLLENIYQLSPIGLDYCFLNPDSTLEEHLSHALPTKRIFYLLRSIRSECLIRDYSKKLMLDTLEIIVKWLQGLVRSLRG